MLEKIIKFSPANEIAQYAIDYPQPASSFMPEWYRKSSKHIDDRYGAKMPAGNTHMTNLTVKACMPFFDAMTSGYVVTLPSDIYFVDQQDYYHRVIWDVSYDVVSHHLREQLQHMPIPEGYNEIFKWNSYFHIQTPPGYSCMFMHPNFFFDAPFMTLSGIVDTDKHPMIINFPFFLKNNFVGKIEKGTPICQIIPFKRESWKMNKEEFKLKNLAANDYFQSVIEKSYKMRFWSRKSYK